MADPAASQHIPQADGPILSSTGQHHGLREQAQGSLVTVVKHLCPQGWLSALVGGSPHSASERPLGTSSQELETRAMGLAWYPCTPPMALTWSMYTVVMAPEWPCRVKRQHESSRRYTWGRNRYQILGSLGFSKSHFSQEFPSTVHPGHLQPLPG